MSDTTQQDQQLTVIDKSIEVFRGGSAVLLDHQTRATKAVAVGQSIIQQWERAYAIQDPADRFVALAAADTRSQTFLVNCRDRNKEMKEVRSAITQLMDSIKGMFTEEENKLDVKIGPIPSKIQLNRNQYVQDRLKEDQRLKKLAEDNAKKEREAVDLRASIRAAFGQALINYQANRKAAWLQSFNSISLANFDEKEAGLKALKTTFSQEKTTEICVVSLPHTYMHTQEEKEAILTEERAAYDFYSFYLKYGQEMADFKKDLEDKLPSKKEELQEQKRLADKAEKDRLDQIECNRIAEQQRQEQILKANSAAEKKRLEKEAEDNRIAEKARLDKIEQDNKAEQDRLKKEQADREEKQRQELAQEQATAQDQVTSQVELGRTAGHAQSLFDQQAAISSTAPAPSSRQGFEIKVKNPAGWVELFTFWFQREGVSTPIDGFEKKTLGSMKKFAESVATKADKEGKTDMIASKSLEYVAVAKAVNVKEKKEASYG